MKNEPLLFALRAIILPCLSHPEVFEVVDVGDTFPIYSVSIHTDDCGKCIGRKGANIFALKALGEFVGKICGHTVRISVKESSHIVNRGPLPAWSLELCAEGVRAMLRAARLPDDGKFVEGRPGEYHLMLAADPPEDFAQPLNRWLAVMGGAAGCRLVLDETHADA